MIEEWIAIVSAGVALAAAGVSSYFSHTSLSHEKFNTKIQYFSALRSWADEASTSFSKAIHLCDIDPKRCEAPSFFDRRLELRTHFSSLIDRGKWYFPNIRHGEIGVTKEPAFRGLRQEVLNNLVTAYKALGELNYSEQEPNLKFRKRLVHYSREFTSEIQEILDPRVQAEEFERLVEKNIAE